jgi:hypothetical protein
MAEAVLDTFSSARFGLFANITSRHKRMNICFHSSPRKNWFSFLRVTGMPEWPPKGELCKAAMILVWRLGILRTHTLFLYLKRPSTRAYKGTTIESTASWVNCKFRDNMFGEFILSSTSLIHMGEQTKMAINWSEWGLLDNASTAAFVPLAYIQSCNVDPSAWWTSSVAKECSISAH